MKCDKFCKNRPLYATNKYHAQWGIKYHKKYRWKIYIRNLFKISRKNIKAETKLDDLALLVLLIKVVDSCACGLFVWRSSMHMARFEINTLRIYFDIWRIQSVDNLGHYSIRNNMNYTNNLVSVLWNQRGI